MPDFNHERMMEDGWSWIELAGGPKDGNYSYFKGSPKWDLYFVDPSVDPSTYKEGDREHHYELDRNIDGHAIYRWRGDFRRAKPGEIAEGAQ